MDFMGFALVMSLAIEFRFVFCRSPIAPNYYLLVIRNISLLVFVLSAELHHLQHDCQFCHCSKVTYATSALQRFTNATDCHLLRHSSWGQCTIPTSAVPTRAILTSGDILITKTKLLASSLVDL